jgi:DNA-binding transcriptional LysR family regulator
MARRDNFDSPAEFLAIAEHGSFRAAASGLSVTSGAII